LYKKRFWGLPTGVRALPTLAAMVSKMMTYMRERSSPLPVKAMMVSGTKVMRATSLVMSIEEKKVRATKEKATPRRSAVTVSSASERALSTR